MKNAIAEPRNSELPSCGVRTQKQRLELVQRAKGLRFNVRDKNSRFQVGERTALTSPMLSTQHELPAGGDI